MRISINFSPREHIYARKVYAALAVCLFVAASAFAAGYGAYVRAEGRAEPLAARVASIEADVKELDVKLAGARKTVDAGKAKSDAKQVAFVNGVIRQRAFSWTTFLNRVEGLVPEGVGITSIRPDFASLNVEVTGTAEGVGQVLQFVGSLTKSPYFGDIPPVFNTSEVVADKDVGKKIQQFSFRISYYPEGRPGAAPEALDEAQDKAPEENAGQGG